MNIKSIKNNLRICYEPIPLIIHFLIFFSLLYASLRLRIIARTPITSFLILYLFPTVLLFLLFMFLGNSSKKIISSILKFDIRNLKASNFFMGFVFGAIPLIYNPLFVINFINKIPYWITNFGLFIRGPFYEAAKSGFFEEVIFRGFYYSYILAYLNKHEYFRRRDMLHFSILILVPSILFSLIHYPRGGFGSMMLMFFGGFFFTIIRWKTNNLIPPIIAHFCYNLILMSSGMQSIFLSLIYE